MASRTTSALLLRVVDFGEADRIVHLLTPDRGRVTALAKSARKSQRRFPGTLDLFNLLTVELTPRSRGRLTLLDRARLADPHLALRRTPQRYALASYLTELLDRLAPEGGPSADCEGLFDVACESLAYLAAGDPGVAQRILLELRLLAALGLRPEFRHCVRCGKEAAGPQVFFHVGEGGVHCGTCGESDGAGVRVSVGTLRGLEQGLRFALPHIDRIALGRPGTREALGLVVRFHRFHLGFELRSERFLNDVFHVEGRRAA